MKRSELFQSRVNIQIHKIKECMLTNFYTLLLLLSDELYKILYLITDN
jgi:hypothetical protein